MQLCLINHNFKYEIEKLIRIFFPFEKIEFSEKEQIKEFCIISKIQDDNAYAEFYFYGKTYLGKRKIQNINVNTEKNSELFLALAVFDCLTAATGYFPDWGILTGVRPAKLFSRLKKENGEAFSESYFKDYLNVNLKKILLCKESLKGEGNITSLSKPDSFSLYISIPFCPSRCSYCSFVSHSIEKAQKLIPKYIEYLIKEIKYTAKIAENINLRLETIYIGGGTPTTLTAAQLEQIMKAIKNYFSFDNLREYTVEAGRPDTITKEKLEIIKKYGCTRISINPQTMNESVLKIIGRNHTCEQTVNAFSIARECGFNNINADLIAGLPGDTYESFKSSLEKIILLNPESVTVHSLSMKRSSTLTQSGEIPEFETGKTASLMVDYAYNALCENNISPYYMYRQSKTVGNLENVGYSKKGYECLYNVFIMDETHTILSCGASAVTKLREPYGEKIERIFNYKYPYEYIDKFDEILNRKEYINKFYSIYKI